MRLNNDCVRDILLSVEEVCDFNESFRYSKFSNDFERLQPYSHDEIIYHIKQCKLAGLITSMFATTVATTAYMVSAIFIIPF